MPRGFCSDDVRRSAHLRAARFLMPEGDSMLWQKSWWETRLGLLFFMGVALSFAVWRLPLDQAALTKWISELQPSWSEDSRRLLPLLSSYQGYVWSYWFKLALLGMWPMYAVAQGVTLGSASCP